MEIQKKQSGFGIASLILGIVGILTSCICIGIVPCILGVIFSIIALASNYVKKGTAIAGLICSIMGIFVFIVMLFAMDSDNGNIEDDSQIAVESEANADFMSEVEEQEDETEMIINTESSNTEENVSDKEDNNNSSDEENKYVSQDEIENVFSNPKEYKGKYIKITGKIFTNPEIEKDKITFQMFHDVENNEDNVYVTFETENAKEISNYEYVVVEGKIKGSSSGMNAFGGIVSALKLEAISVEESNYIDVVSPTQKELLLNQTLEQYGYSVTIDKIEFAEKETRVYVTVVNNGSDKFHFRDYSAKIVQDGKQYEMESKWNADYEEIPSELLPGTSASGIVTFPVLNMEKGFTIYSEAGSENWNEDIEDYVFEISNE